MAYRTQASHDLIDHLHIMEMEYERRLDEARKTGDAFDRGLWSGYKDATKAYRDFAEQWLEKIEAEAALVPAVEEDPIDWLQKQMANFPMAGDYRDWPA